MKRVLGFFITLLIHLLFRLRKTLLERGWIGVETPRDLYVHLQADNVRLSSNKVQKLILKSHEGGQQMALVSMDDAVAQEFRSAGFIVVLQESGKYTIMW